MAKTIGIDFGTTKTMVSYFNPVTGRAELVRLGRDKDSIPTTAHIDESGQILFGEDADDQIEIDSEGYCRAFKLCLGENEPLTPRCKETAESLAARFLEHVKKECEQSVFHGETVGSATITVPVSFSPARKASLKRAAQKAGFSSVTFLPEPEAAGTAFLHDNPADRFSRALVLDWGGGTLDIAIISRDEDGAIRADHHCTEGRDDIGGEELDRGLLKNLEAIWEYTTGERLITSEEQEPKILRLTEKVKIALSGKDVVTFRKGKQKVEITRDKFRRIVGGVLDIAVDLVQTSLSKNRANGLSDPDVIILIGGTCLSPVVREAMESAFPDIRVLSWHHSHEAVAIGATLHGCNSAVFPNECERTNGIVPVVSEPSKRKTPWKSGEALEKYIGGHRMSHEDFFYLLRSICVILWRLSPINNSFLAMGAELQKISEGEDAKVVSLRIREALNSVALGGFYEQIEELSDLLSEVLKDAVSTEEDYLELYPWVKSFLKDQNPGFQDELALTVKQDIAMNLRRLKDVFLDLASKHKMLCEGYARYDKIIAGSSFWLKAAMGGVVAILTGGLGVVAAVAWSGWKGMSDKDFAENFVNALQEFCTSCADFLARGEELLVQAVMSKQGVWNANFSKKETCLRALNAEGLDLDDIKRRINENYGNEIRNSEDALENHNLVAMAIDCLKEEGHMSQARIENLIKELREGGLLLAADGSVDENAIYALQSASPGEDDFSSKFLDIVGRCRLYDNFYILGDVPYDKKINALRDYGLGLSEEDVLCLYDSTFFGGGGDGFMIAADGIYSKQLWVEPCSWRWDEIRSVNTTPGNTNVVKINNVDVDVPNGGAENFSNMFRRLRSLFTE